MSVTSNITKQFTVRLEGFEGPLDLLLSLIEKRKLPINGVSLATVTDEYIAHIERAGEFPLSQTAHFILVASTLLLIKSKSLLPSLELSADEEEDIESLQKRLLLYKQIKEVSLHVRDHFGAHVLFEGGAHDRMDVVFSPPQDANLGALTDAIHRVLSNLPKIELVPKAIVKKVISIEEMIGNLTERITKSIRMTFSEFSNVKKSEKVEVIVGFLAMLELVKQGIINVVQERQFADITMETEAVGVPTYE